jgi:hypothetical protein
MQTRTLESKSLPNCDPTTDFSNRVTIRARKIAEIRIFLLFPYISGDKKSAENLFVFSGLLYFSIFISAAEGKRMENLIYS